LAEDGAQAVDACRRKRYDLVLMDVHMPVMDGVEATSRIREMEKNNRHTPIVALTANAMSGDRERYLAAGMDDYLGKPINEKAFVATLQKFGLIAEVPAAPPAVPVATDMVESLPILDPQLGAKLAFGDRATWRSLLEMLFKQLPQDLERLRAEQGAQNADAIKELAHKIAGAAGYCGTPALTNEAKAVENLVKAGEVAAALQEVDELIRQIEKLLALQTDGKIPESDSPIF
jgi:two-component system sensor histidine kinase BarA